MSHLPNSRKLWGVIIVLGALLLLAVVGAVAVSFFGVGENLFATIAAIMGSLGMGHQGAQAAADRSPNYTPSSPALVGGDEMETDCATMVPKSPPPAYTGPLVP